jgi:hypothetical protein
VDVVAGGIGDALKKARLERAFLLLPILADVLSLLGCAPWFALYCNWVAIYSV